MKYLTMFFLSLVLLISCNRKEEAALIETFEDTLVGTWEIESIVFNKFTYQTIYQGDTLTEGDIINNVGLVEFPVFSADTVLLNSNQKSKLPFSMEIDGETFSMEIDYLLIREAGNFGAFRNLEELNPANSLVSQFVETSLIFSRNSDINIVDSDSIVIEEAGGDYEIFLSRI